MGDCEFDYLRLGEGFVQCSSIMPQKRNPVALEHARAIASKALGQTQAIVTAVHNTPATSSTPRTTCSLSSSRPSAMHRAGFGWWQRRCAPPSSTLAA